MASQEGNSTMFNVDMQIYFVEIATRKIKVPVRRLQKFQPPAPQGKVIDIL